MTIYDVRFYGVHYPKMNGGSRVLMSQSMENVYEKAPKQFRFEATVLKRFGSKKDVLQLRFVSGELEYVTLYEPGLYLEDGQWKPTENREVSKAFLKEYEKMQQKERTWKNTKLFDMTFYGLYEDWGIGCPKVVISLSREWLNTNNSFTSNAISFTARILKEFKGNKYIVMLVSRDCVEYVPLFNGKMCYDGQADKWVECRESPIPNEIIKYYIKHLND